MNHEEYLEYLEKFKETNQPSVSVIDPQNSRSNCVHLTSHIFSCESTKISDKRGYRLFKGVTLEIDIDLECNLTGVLVHFTKGHTFKKVFMSRCDFKMTEEGLQLYWDMVFYDDQFKEPHGSWFYLPKDYYGKLGPKSAIMQ